MRGQPAHAGGLTREADGLQEERRTAEFAPRDGQVRPEDIFQIGEHPIVGGGGRGEDADIGRQGADHALDQSVVRAKVMTPVGNAVGLIDDQQRDAARDRREHLPAEVGIAQPLRRDEQDIDLVPRHLPLDYLPLSLILGIDGHGPDPHPRGRRDLIAHQCQQRGDQDRRPAALFAKELGRDEIDRALSPTRLLHHQQPTAALHYMPDGILLPVAKACAWILGAEPEVVEGAGGIVRHRGGMGLLLRNSRPMAPCQRACN